MSEDQIVYRERGELKTLDELLNLLKIDTTGLHSVALEGDSRLIRSPHKLVDAVSTVQLLIGYAAAAVWHARTGKTSNIRVNTIDALHSLHSSHFVWQQGAYLEVGAEYVPINGFYSTRDDRQVLLCAGPPYMKLLNGYLEFFEAANNRQSIERAVARYNAGELEDALAALGLPCSRAFDRDEWLLHPQGKALSNSPIIEIEKIGDGDPVPFDNNGRYPLDGIRVMDFTHVLAGPHSTQSLAELGAHVLHVSSPLHADTLAQHLGVDMGKYCAYLNLGESNQLQTMHRLCADADVFSTSYRPSVNERFGLTPQELAARSSKGIIALSVNAYGHTGPWAGRAGFDPNGQAASGFASGEGGGVQTPKLSPVFYLADLMTGHFAAAGMISALLRRAREGGSWHVKVSLARSAMWVQELGKWPEEEIDRLPATDTYPYQTRTVHTAYGDVATLQNAVRYEGLKLPEADRLVPYGADLAGWNAYR